MIRLALEMLIGDRVKALGLMLGVAFTAFLVTFAAGYFAGFMTNGFALITENSAADVWVMDPAVMSVEATINVTDAALNRVRAVPGVARAWPMLLADVEARFPNGRFQTFQLVGLDDVTLAGLPDSASPDVAARLRTPDAVVVASGGTSGKLGTPAQLRDQWPYDGAHLNVPLRPLAAGDQVLVNGLRVRVAAQARVLERFPPRPLMYTGIANARRLLPPERQRPTFVLVRARDGVSSRQLAQRIERQTGLRARPRDAFKADTVRWYLVNSEDVGDMTAMLMLAMVVGFGVAGIMLYMFSYENLRQYAVFKAMGASGRQLVGMVLAQAGGVAVLATGIGLGLCSLAGSAVAASGHPFRMLWFAPVLGAGGVLLISLTAALISVRPLLKLSPGEVFAGR